MGGMISSKVSSSFTSYSTPSYSKRTLGDDPRSPSAEIFRTPIFVDKTPEIILDPRSPTAGIDRTPITFSLNQDERETEDAFSTASSPVFSECSNSSSICIPSVPVSDTSQTEIPDNMNINFVEKVVSTVKTSQQQFDKRNNLLQVNNGNRSPLQPVNKSSQSLKTKEPRISFGNNKVGISSTDNFTSADNKENVVHYLESFNSLGYEHC